MTCTPGRTSDTRRHDRGRPRITPPGRTTRPPNGQETPQQQAARQNAHPVTITRFGQNPKTSQSPGLRTFRDHDHERWWFRPKSRAKPDDLSPPGQPFGIMKTGGFGPAPSSFASSAACSVTLAVEEPRPLHHVEDSPRSGSQGCWRQAWAWIPGCGRWVDVRDHQRLAGRQRLPGL